MTADIIIIDPITDDPKLIIRFTNKDELCRFVFDDARNTGAMRRPLSATVIGIYSGTIPNKFIVLSPPGCNWRMYLRISMSTKRSMRVINMKIRRTKVENRVTPNVKSGIINSRKEKHHDSSIGPFPRRRKEENGATISLLICSITNGYHIYL